MSLNLPRAGLLLAACLAPVLPASAGDWLQWHDTSLTVLHGSDFHVQPERQQTLTIEHANGWKYGDTFLFVDTTRFDGSAGTAGRTIWYGEFAPRVSLGKLSGREVAAGPLRDVLLAGAYEFGEGDVESWLLGPGFDLDLPGFDYVQLNVYRRHTRGGRDGDGQWQLTPVWAWTVPVGRSDLVVDGFVDWVVGRDGGAGPHLHIVPQVKYDLGKALGWGDKAVYVGVEYDYWKNKFGIDDDGPVGHAIPGGTDQSTVSVLLKVHLP